MTARPSTRITPRPWFRLRRVGGQGKYLESATLQTEALELRKRVLGPEHPDTLTSMNNLALLHMEQGRDAESEALYVQLLVIAKRVLGLAHPSTLTVMNNLAYAYARQGKYDEAAALQAQTLEISKRTLSPEHPDTLNRMNNLANTYHSQGKLSEAELIQAQTLEIMKRVLGPENRRTLGLMNVLGAVQARQGKYHEAAALHAQTLEIARRVLGPEHLETITSWQNLAYAYEQASDYARAEETLLALLASASQREGTTAGSAAAATKARQQDALQRLVQLYTRWGKPERAAESQKQADALYATSSGTEQREPNIARRESTPNTVAKRVTDERTTLAATITPVPAKRSDITTAMSSNKEPAAKQSGVSFDAAAAQAIAARQLGLPVEQTNSLGMVLRLIPAGEFEMGSTEDEVSRLLEEGNWFFSGYIVQRLGSEIPRHKVRLSRPFFMGVHEVTVGQFRTFVTRTGYKTVGERSPKGGFGWTDNGWRQSTAFGWTNPGFNQSDTHPVANLAWEDANEFCRWLSAHERRGYRLPTEAEWEYACRAGTTTWFCNGNRDLGLKSVANIADESLRLVAPQFDWARPWDDGFPFTAPVGKFSGNAFGLHDMHGNVWEWCQDFYDPKYYGRSPMTDPLCLEPTTYHVFRGGGWDNYPGFCRSADRYSSHSRSLRTEWAGFRIVSEAVTKQE